MTYSIVARDPETGRFGIAVQSHFLGVGPVVPWLEAGVGAIATQASVNVAFGPTGLELLRAGSSAEQVVAAVLAGDDDALTARPGTVRTVQRHFLLATGMTHRTWRQIQRARHAAFLLRTGASIAEAVHGAGYFDQAHLTRSLQRRMGTTPARIQRQEQQLLFLYKTSAWGRS